MFELLAHAGDLVWRLAAVAAKFLADDHSAVADDVVLMACEAITNAA
jgi:hypothetical protein